MDSQKFDRVARLLGKTPSRRGVLRGLIAAAGMATASRGQDASAHKDRRARLKAKMCPPCDVCYGCWDGRCVWVCG